MSTVQQKQARAQSHADSIVGRDYREAAGNVVGKVVNSRVETNGEEVCVVVTVRTPDGRTFTEKTWCQV